MEIKIIAPFSVGKQVNSCAKKNKRKNHNYPSPDKRIETESKVAVRKTQKRIKVKEVYSVDNRRDIIDYSKSTSFIANPTFENFANEIGRKKQKKAKTPVIPSIESYRSGNLKDNNTFFAKFLTVISATAIGSIMLHYANTASGNESEKYSDEFVTTTSVSEEYTNAETDFTDVFTTTTKHETSVSSEEKPTESERRAGIDCTDVMHYVPGTETTAVTSTTAAEEDEIESETTAETSKKAKKTKKSTKSQKSQNTKHYDFDFKYDKNFDDQLEAFAESFRENRKRYEYVAKQTGLPAELIAAIHFREGSCEFDRCLENGDYLDYGESWEETAIEILNDEKSRIPGNLGEPDFEVIKGNYETYFKFAEAYNGLGYRNNGHVSAYVWSGTSKYTSGLYVADGVYKNIVDERPGVALLLMSLDLFDIEKNC